MIKLSIVAAAALAVAGAALAHPHPEGTADGEKARKFVIITDHADAKGKGKGHAGATHFRSIHLDGDRLASCLGSKTLANETAGDEKDKTRIVICGKDGDSSMDAARLEQALARINSSEHVSAEHKEKITAALREAIEKARSAR